jgi:hypothetical protein
MREPSVTSNSLNDLPPVERIEQSSQDILSSGLPSRDSSIEPLNSNPSEFLVALNVDGLGIGAAGALGLSASDRRSIVVNATKLRDQFVASTGNSDGGVNSNPFGRHFGNDGAPWCGYFVDRVMQFSGMKMPQMFNVIEGAKDARRLGQWRTSSYTPGEGDAVVFDFEETGTIEGADHVGIVVGLVRNGQGKITHVKTIEGNTSAGSAGSQADGDGIYFRTRPLSQVVGYVVPRKN